jgi:quercetin dioxygenase-like cupin family protein
MRITRADTAGLPPSENPIFVGEVAAQTIVDDAAAELLRVTAVTFRDGARNRWHTHAADQVLVITAGLGTLADETGEHPVEPGDVVLINAGERHWHGARPGATMTHLSILTPGELTITD